MTSGPTIEKLKYPIGQFRIDSDIDPEMVNVWISEIEELPARVRATVENLSNQQLDTPYRKDGWTVRQVVHHLNDSHMNSFVRFKLALTEDRPTIRPYDEKLLAELSDSRLSNPGCCQFASESTHKMGDTSGLTNV